MHGGAVSKHCCCSKGCLLRLEGDGHEQKAHQRVILAALLAWVVFTQAKREGNIADEIRWTAGKTGREQKLTSELSWQSCWHKWSSHRP